MKEKSRLFYLFALTKYIKGFHLYLGISIVCNAVFKLIPLVLTLFTSYMISAIVLGSAEKTKLLFAFVCVFIVLQAVFAYLDILVGHDMAYRILAKLRIIAYNKIDELAPAGLENERSGDLISIVLDDVEILEWFYAHTIAQIFVAFLIPLAALIFMGSLSPYLPVTLLPFLIALLLFPKFKKQKADVHGFDYMKAAGDLNAESVDCIQGLKDIISFRYQRRYFQKMSTAIEKFNTAVFEDSKRRITQSQLLSFLILTASFAVTIVAALLVKQGRLSPLWFLPVLTLSSAFLSPIADALNMSTQYGLIFAAAKRLFNLLRTEPEVYDTGTKTVEDVIAAGNANGAGKSTGTEMRITVKDVAFTYPQHDSEKHNPKILDGISFTVKTGETLALAGRSGSGKTTTARLLQRLREPDAGAITINGIDIRELRLKALRDIITVIPQDVYLFNTTIEENLRLAKRDASFQEIQAAATQAQAASFIEQLPDGYGTVIGERALKLSGGEKARLAIAQAFLKNSPVLVLDEASANLDSDNERKINEAVTQLKKGRITLVIAHRLSTIKAADRIIVLKDGRVEAEGSFPHLMQSSAYFRELIGEGDGQAI